MFLATLVQFLQGKKTYIIAVLMIILGYLQANQQMILEGLGLITLRAGIAKVSQ